MKTSPSNPGSVGSNPGWGVKIPYAFGQKKKAKQSNTVTKQILKQYFNKFNNTFLKSGPYKKKNLKKRKKQQSLAQVDLG